MKERLPVGFMFKQINNIYEKEFNNLLRGIGITSSQCAVLDYLLGSSKEFVNQKDIEKALSLKNPTVTGILKRLDEKGFILAVPSNQDKVHKVSAIYSHKFISLLESYIFQYKKFTVLFFYFFSIYI